MFLARGIPSPSSHHLQTIKTMRETTTPTASRIKSLFISTLQWRCGSKKCWCVGAELRNCTSENTVASKGEHTLPPNTTTSLPAKK